MAKLLATPQIVAAFDEIVRRSKSELILVTPYVQLGETLLQRLRDAADRGVKITIVYGKSELPAPEKDKLDTIQNIAIHYLDNLHAKCYVGDERAIVGSMNLYDFSARNREIAVLLTAADDAEAFADAHEEVESIIRAAQHGTDHTTATPSQPHRPAAHGARPAAPAKPAQPQKLATLAKTEGHCIRCGKAKPYDPEHPLCRPCYEVWAEWKNPDYEENHCHRCGAEEATSVARPLCGKCFRAAPFTPRRHAFG